MQASALVHVGVSKETWEHLRYMKAGVGSTRALYICNDVL